MKLIGIIFSLFCFNLFATQMQWRSITPLLDCNEFKIQYRYSNGYEVRYRSAMGLDYQYAQKKIKDINDLSEISDELLAASDRFCPEKFYLKAKDGEYDCFRKTYNKDDFTPEIVNLYDDVISILARSKPSCDEIKPLLRLQSELPNLNQSQKLEFEETFDFFKLFANEQNDEYIDLFNHCGGKENSEQFVKNILLMKTKDACLYPKPPGSLSFSQVEKLASSLASDYKDQRLLSISGDINKLTKKASIKFAKEILSNTVNDLFGHDRFTNNIVNSLKGFKKLQAVKEEDASEYLTYKFSPEIPFELMEKAYPKLIEQNFSSILKDTSAQDIAKIVNQSKEHFFSCIKPLKQRLKVDDDLTYDELLTHRKKLKNEFCTQNPSTCSSNGCSAKVNLLSTDPSINDNDLIKKCVFKGINNALTPTLQIVIGTQLQETKPQTNFSESKMNEIIEKSNQFMNFCIKKKVSLKSKEKNYETSLLKLSPDDFKTSLLECSKVLEKDLTSKISTRIISELPPLKEKENGQLTSKQLSQKSIEDCLNEQAKIYPKSNQSASLCAPLIEKDASSFIITESLEKTLLEENASPQKVNEIIGAFNTCSKNSRESLLKQYSNKSAPKISNSEQAKAYLLNNHKHLNCVKGSIEETIKIVIDKKVYELSKNMNDQLKDQAYLEQYLPTLKQKIKNCFQNELDKHQNWPSFVEFNANDGIDQLKSRCTEQAELFILPKVMGNELSLNIKALRDQNLTNLSEKDLIQEISKNYALTLSPNSQLEDVLSFAYINFQAKDPSNKREEFIVDFKDKIQLGVISDIHDSLFKTIAQKGRSFSGVRAALNPSCLNSLLAQYKDSVDKLNSNDSQGSTAGDTMDKLADFFTKGLNGLRKTKQYRSYVNKIKNICENPKKYSNIEDLVATGIFDEAIFQTLKDKIQEGFKKAMIDQCLDDLAPFADKLYDKEKSILCSPDKAKRQKSSKLLNSIAKRLSGINEDDGVKLKFIQTRFLNSMNDINSKLREKDIRDIFLQDREILNLIYSNFPKIIKNDESILSKIETKAVSRIFKDRSKGSFAGSFIENQLIGAVGIQGLEGAKSTLEKKVNEGFWNKIPLVKDKVRRLARPAFYNHWEPKTLKEYLNWENLDNNKRNELISGVLENNILSKIDATTSKAEQEKRDKALSDLMLNHFNNYPNTENPNYRDLSKLKGRNKRAAKAKNTPRLITLPERISIDITNEIKSNLLKFE